MAGAGAWTYEVEYLGELKVVLVVPLWVVWVVGVEARIWEAREAQEMEEEEEVVEIEVVRVQRGRMEQWVVGAAMTVVLEEGEAELEVEQTTAWEV
jgi:hypothetical protein